MFKGNFSINLDFFKMKSSPLIGVDISSSSVKMVELSLIDKESKTYRIERYAIESMPADAMLDGAIENMEAVSECLRRGWKRMGTRQRMWYLHYLRQMLLPKDCGSRWATRRRPGFSSRE